jgi:hypothetical protein
MVTVKVGSDLKPYYVHKTLICSRSSYFKAAFTSGFKDGKEGVIEFKDLQVPAFELFILWLYHQDTWHGESGDDHPAALDLIQLYIFADMIQIPALKNDTIKLLEKQVMRTGQGVPLQHLNYLWANTPDESPLRRFLADMCAHNLSPDHFDVTAKFPGNKAVLLSILKAYTDGYGKGPF